jgi:hypothetical protein
MTQLTDKLIAILVPFVEGLNINNERLFWDWIKNNPKENGGFNDEYKIIGTVTKDSIDFDCENFIMSKFNNKYHQYIASGKMRVSSMRHAFPYDTPQESFISLLNSKGLFLDKLENEKILILEVLKK